MKKYFGLIMLMIAVVLASAQSTTPRFGTLKSEDNTGRSLTYGYINKTYAATDVIRANAYETTVNIATLTGAQTLTANVTSCKVADKMSILFTADGSNRTVTFSTGFASGGTLTIQANTKATVYFVFNGVGWFQLSGQSLAVGLVGDGLVSAPTLGFTSQTDMGFYKVSATEMGVAIGGAKAAGFTATAMNLSGSATTVGANVRKLTATAYTSAATVTPAEIVKGLLTVTSGTNTLTLPTATDLGALIGAGAGTNIEFSVLNIASGGTVTIGVGSGITASGFPATNTLTLANSATVGIATFRISFLSATAATLTRIN